MPRCMVCRGSSIRVPSIISPDDTVNDDNPISSLVIDSEEEEKDVGPSVYWRFCETPDRRIIIAQTDRKISFRTKNWAVSGLSQMGHVVTTCLTPDLSDRPLAEACRWSLSHDCPLEGEDEWGEQGANNGSIRFGVDRSGVGRYSTVVYTWGVIAPPEKSELKPWTFEMWIKLIPGYEDLPSWDIARLAFTTFGGGPSFSLHLKAAISSAGLTFSLSRILIPDHVPTEIEFQPIPTASNTEVALSDGQLDRIIKNRWMFLSLVVSKDKPPTLYVRQEGWHIWEQTATGESLEALFGTDPTMTLNKIEIGSMESRGFEATEVRFFTMARDIDTIKDQSTHILPDGVPSQSNLIRKIQIRTDVERLQEIPEVVQLPPPSASPDALLSEHSGRRLISSIQSTSENVRNQQNGHDLDYSLASIPTSRSLDTLDKEATTNLYVDPTPAPTSLLGGISELPSEPDSSLSLRRETSGGSIVKPLPSLIMNAKDNAEESGVTHEHESGVECGINSIRETEKNGKAFAIDYHKQMESLYASKFMREVGTEILYASDKLPPSIPNIDWDDPAILLMTLNHHLSNIHLAIVSCKFLEVSSVYHLEFITIRQALQLNRLCLQVCAPVLRNGAFLEPVPKSDKSRTVDVISADQTKIRFETPDQEPVLSRDYFSLGPDIAVRQFDRSYILRLTRRTRLNCSQIPQWRRKPYLANVLQAHIASMSRCVLVIRLILAALWVLYDVSLLLDDVTPADEKLQVKASGAKRRVCSECPTLSGNFDAGAIWSGAGWGSTSEFLSKSQELHFGQKAALEYLWIDLISIFTLINSIGLPYGLPLGFRSSLTVALNNMGQSDFLSNSSPIEICFLSGSRLSQDDAECPVCCARYSSEVRSWV